MHYGIQQPQLRYNGKCKRCGSKASILLAQLQPSKTLGMDIAIDEQGNEFPFVDYRVKIVHECSAGQTRYIALAPVRGVYNPGKECNAKCMAAIGHDCECRCGGKNHGSSFTLV